MDNYSIALFLHVVGALGFFVALGLEWTSLRQLRHAATAEQVREWMSVSIGVSRVGIASMLTILISGFYMMVTVWGMVAWIAMSLGAIVLGIILTLTLTGPQMAAIGRALTTEKGTVSPTLHHLLHNPLLWISIQTRVALALGIVLLKVVKPHLDGSLLIMGVVIVLGLVSALPIPRPHRERVQEGLADGA